MIVRGELFRLRRMKFMMKYLENSTDDFPLDTLSTRSCLRWIRYRLCSKSEKTKSSSRARRYRKCKLITKRFHNLTYFINMSLH